MAMEGSPFIDDFPLKLPSEKRISKLTMFVYRSNDPNYNILQHKSYLHYARIPILLMVYISIKKIYINIPNLAVFIPLIVGAVPVN